MKILTLLGFLSSLILLAESALMSFSEFKQSFNKKYTSVQEEMLRRRFFARNLREIDRLNRKAAAYDVPVVYGVNKFADRHPLELSGEGSIVSRSVVLKKAAKDVKKTSQTPTKQTSSTPKHTSSKKPTTIAKIRLDAVNTTASSSTTTKKEKRAKTTSTRAPTTLVDTTAFKLTVQPPTGFLGCLDFLRHHC